MTFRSILVVAFALVLLAAACASGEDPVEVAATPVASTTTLAQPTTLPEPTISVKSAAATETTLPGAATPDEVLPWKGGFLAIHTIDQPTPFPELTEEQTARFPEEVLDLFAGSPPETVGEAISRVIEADLTDEMETFFRSNDDLYTLIMETRTPSKLEAWTTADGIDWEFAGPLEPPGEVDFTHVVSDGERLLIAGDAAIVASPDLQNWTSLPIPASEHLWVSTIDAGSGGWAASIYGSSEFGGRSVLLGDWSDDPVSVMVDVDVIDGSLVRTETGAVALASEDRDTVLLSVDGERGTYATGALPDGSQTATLSSLDGGALLSTPDSLLVSRDDGATWNRVELPGLPADLLLVDSFWGHPPDRGLGYAVTPELRAQDSDLYGPGPVVVATEDGERWIIDDLRVGMYGFDEPRVTMGDGIMLVMSEASALVYEFR